MKTNIRQITGLFAAALLLLATGCTDENPIEDPTPQSAERLYILNDGGLGANNASLSVLDLKTGSVTADIFSTANGSPLGDTANDILVLEDRIAIAVNGSNIIQICDLDGKSIASVK